MKQEQAAQRYFKAEGEQQFELDENASQTLTFKNEPKAALNVSLNYKKEYELKRGNAPEYPLTGATMTLYEVKDDDKLVKVESFNMTNPTETIPDLHGLKHYVLVERKFRTDTAPMNPKIRIMRTAKTRRTTESRAIIRMC